MTIILFLIDTSASMCQKAHVNGVQKTYLDIAKGSVEIFLKYRQRSQDCMGDRYMLLTFEDPPCNVKAGWKENHATFMNELKNLQSNGLTSMGEALKNAFDLLNLNRMQSGIDTYGQGRCPFYLEPSVIIIITDGGKYSYRNGIHQEIILPLMAQIPGTKFTKEPFRWDQRLFSLVLRMAGNKLDERVEGKVPHDDSPIEKMCEVTGGRSYRIKSHHVLNQCIESLVLKVQPGVVVNFEQLILKDPKDGDIQDLVFPTTKRMIFVHKNPTQKTFPVGFWPIPEPYWPDPKAATLPPRDAHPKIKISTQWMDEPQLVRNFPIDKYELEPSPLTLQLLTKREPTKCWPVIVPNGMHGLELPFGYLKANATFTQIYLMILPYNFQTLLPLLNDLYQKYNLNPPNDWIYKFSQYVRSIPQYYVPFLRRALLSSNVPYPLLQYILPENLDGYLSPAVANCLKQMKNTAKVEQDSLCMRVSKQLKFPKPPYHPIETTKLHCPQPLKRDLVTHPMLKETFNKLHSEINTYENYTIVVPSIFNSVATKNYRNPFDIPRNDLIDEIARMRENFFKVPISGSGINIYTKDAGHSLPIAEMGNYQEYLKNKEPPLREIEPTNVRQHMFGNPYKKDKHMVMVDEADLGDVAPIRSPNAPNTQKKGEMPKISRKRKAGPIRKDYMFRPMRRESTSSTDSRDIYEGNLVICESDEDTASETSSLMSDEGSEGIRMAEDFDEFNDPAVNDFPINGHIQDFINGEIEDTDDGPPIPPIPIVHTPQQIIPPQILLPVHMMATAVSPSNNNTTTSSSNVVITSNHVGNLNHPTSPAIQVPPALITMPAPFLQNDINDAQEISKILQTCHNGNSNNNNHDQKSTNVLASNTTTTTTTINHVNDRGRTTTNNSIKKEENDDDPITNENHVPKIIEEDGNGGVECDGDEMEEIDEEAKENMRQKNLEIRSIVFKDIRRPGRDYTQLLEHLELFKGDFGTRFNCIQMCINESLRFRRKKMADSIQDWWEKQIDGT